MKGFHKKVVAFFVYFWIDDRFPIVHAPDQISFLPTVNAAKKKQKLVRYRSEAQAYLYKKGKHLTYKADIFCGEIYCEKTKSKGLNYHDGEFYGNGRKPSDSVMILCG